MLGFLRPLLILFVLAGVAPTQDLPDKIRGYKVHEMSTTAERPTLRIGKPALRLDGLLSVAVEAGGEFTSPEHSGRVEFLTFHDIRINGVAVDVDEYRHGFKFKKGMPVTLSAPLRGRIGLGGIAHTAYTELKDPRTEWRVTGTAFVFGKFKRYGLSFKRVVPVKLDFMITNPLR